MREHHFLAGFDSKPLYTKLYISGCPHTRAEYRFEVNVEVEGLKMEMVISQPAPPLQCHLSPRRLPAVGTGWSEPGGSRAETQLTERKGGFPFSSSCQSRWAFARQLLKPGPVGYHYFASCRRRGSRRRNNNFCQRASRWSQRVCETIEVAVVAKDDSME